MDSRPTLLDVTAIPQGQGSQLNSDLIDGFHAYSNPFPNSLLPLNPKGQFPTSVVPTSGGGGSGFLLGNGAPTDKNLLIADGTLWQSRVISGDISLPNDTGTINVIGVGNVTSGVLKLANGGTGTSTVFTTGSIIFAGTSGIYSQDNAHLFWDQSNHRLGIETNVPLFSLHSNGAIALTGSSSFINPSTLKVDFTTLGRLTSTGTLNNLTINTYTGVGTNPYGIAFDGTNMWITNFGDNSLSKVSPSGSVINFSALGLNQPTGIAFDGTNMWICNFGNASITKVTPAGSATTYMSVGTNPQGIAFDGTNMWCANEAGNSVSKITPAGSITTFSSANFHTPVGIAFDGTNMWVVNNTDSSVTKVTPSGATTHYTGAGNNANFIAYDSVNHNMWVTNHDDNSVTVFNSSGTVIATYTGTGTNPFGIAFDGASMWTANFGNASVSKITSSGVINSYSSTGTGPFGIAWDGHAMWTSNYTAGSTSKIAVLDNFGDILLASNNSDVEHDIMYLDGTNIRVGINTNTPAASLEVNGNSQFDGNIIQINGVTTSWPSSQGAVNTYLKNDGSGNLTWDNSVNIKSNTIAHYCGYFRTESGLTLPTVFLTTKNDAAITVKRITVDPVVVSIGVGTGTVFRFTDGSSNCDITLAPGASNATATFTQNYASNSTLQMKVISDDNGTPPTDINMVVEYIIQ